MDKSAPECKATAVEYGPDAFLDKTSAHVITSGTADQRSPTFEYTILTNEYLRVLPTHGKDDTSLGMSDIFANRSLPKMY